MITFVYDLAYMKRFKRTLVTTALPYANGPIHIGHMAGVYIPADIYVRYLRIKKKDILFIGGSDEHGVPIKLKAKKENTTPQNIVNKYHTLIKKSFHEFGISFDIYSRTTSKIHHKTALQFFEKLKQKKKLVQKETENYYDVTNQQFLADRYITGTCPKCGYEKAYGDQCESCGVSLSPKELKNPTSFLSGNIPKLKKTTHWYLPLQDHENFLKKYILTEHQEWKTNVYGQCKSWLDSGLKERAITRDLDWGVKILTTDGTTKVLYVWFDAPIGYISATKELTKDWEKYWKSEDCRLIHFIGKDNIVFHCIIFPAMLHADGNYILPDNVPANEFLNLEGRKISTSQNWAVWLHEYLEDFTGKQDVLRYVLTINSPETKDNDFTWRNFQRRNNNELVAIMGNFVNRTLVLAHKYFNGKVPPIDDNCMENKKIFDDIRAKINLIENNIENFHFREGLREVMNIARIGNKYLADTEPWKIVKTDKKKTQSTINVCLQITAFLSNLLEPFLPMTADKLKKMLQIKSSHWEKLRTGFLPTSHEISKDIDLLFEKITDEDVQIQLDKLIICKVK